MELMKVKHSCLRCEEDEFEADCKDFFTIRGAARKQELISQQNTICRRCRPVISLLPLLIYFLTSAASTAKTKHPPRLQRGARVVGGGSRR